MSGYKLKIVIADNDEPICNLLSDILGTFEGVAVAGRASNGRDLLKLVKDTGPDAVFLDIQMPGLDG
ncbi:MAG: LytR/AlgR family response regulator transcription factor, partial [Desulfofundulus sp.]